MSNTSVHALAAGQNLHHLPSLSLLNHCSLLSPSASRTLPHSLQHMPTHAAAQAHVIWNSIFPSLSLLSLPRTTLILSLLYLSLTCIHVHAPRGPDSHLNWAGSSAPPSPLHLRLSLFLSSFSPQFKSRTHFIVSTGMKPVQPCKEHYVIIWQSLMMLTLTDGWKAKHIEWIWNSTMLSVRAKLSYHNVGHFISR